ncbi:MAG: LamG domain-containing protein, partial [Planctomycetes bacterium]|nr:LamG domain-containing protein [Planctomycetota bacterium]
MKKLIILVLVLSLCGVVQAALVSQWKFDGGLTDNVWTNDGTAEGDGTLSYISGAPYGADPSGQAAHFDGDVWVNVGNDASLQPATAISFTAWIKVERELSDWWQTIYRRPGDGNTRILFDVGTWGGDEGLWIGIGTPDGYVEMVGTVTDAQMRDGNWHLAVGTYDSSVSGQDNMFLYWDGQVVGSGEHSGLMVTDSTEDAKIGAYIPSYLEPFNGGIDDLRVYDHALSAAEVDALFLRGGGFDFDPTPADEATVLTSAVPMALSWSNLPPDPCNVADSTEVDVWWDTLEDGSGGTQVLTESPEALTVDVT